MRSHESDNITERLFDSDAYLSRFDAEVLSCTADSGKFYTVLNKTAFFPEGGGQPGDRGRFILPDSSVIEVIDVRERDGCICHITETPVPLGKISGEINFPLRYQRMRDHSGEHLLSGFAHSMFSCTNVGFHLNDQCVTVDFDKQLTKEQLLELESAVNRAIAEDPDITAYFPSPEVLPELDYRSKLELTENVRIVEISKNGIIYDRCACCAPHVASAAEIGIVLIIDSLNYKGGTRLTMVSGENAYKQARTALSNVRESSSLLSAKPHETAEAVRAFIKRADEDKAAAAAVCSAYLEEKLSHLAPTDGNMVFFEPWLDRNSLRRLTDRAADLCGGICAGFTGSDENGWTYILISRTHDLKAESKELNEKMNGKGGGSSQMIQGTAKASRAELERIFL